MAGSEFDVNNMKASLTIKQTKAVKYAVLHALLKDWSTVVYCTRILSTICSNYISWCRGFMTEVPAVVTDQSIMWLFYLKKKKECVSNESSAKRCAETVERKLNCLQRHRKKCQQILLKTNLCTWRNKNPFTVRVTTPSGTGNKADLWATKADENQHVKILQRKYKTKKYLI